jgi:hypothetical protein
MKNHHYIVLYAVLVFSAIAVLVLPVGQAQAYQPRTNLSESRLLEPQERDRKPFQAPFVGTPTQAYYLPLVKVDAMPTPLPTWTTTPSPTPTATPVVVWYGEGVYDDYHEGMSFNGPWTTGASAGAFQSTLHSSAHIGNEVVFHFENRQISLVYSAGPAYGRVQIWLDGVLITELNQYDTAARKQLQWDSALLSNTRHRLVIRHIGGSLVAVDALIVSDYAYPGGEGVPPPYSSSYYMNSISTPNMQELGCELGWLDWMTPGWQDNLVVLDFGQPRNISGGGYGASLFGMGPVSTSQIATAVMTVGYWYYMCSGDEPLSHLRIGIGTNNYGSQVTPAHGAAWAVMVNQVNQYFTTQGIGARMDAVGANDMELSWNTVSITRAWVDGYASVNQYPLYNFGDAGGCPSANYPNWSCNNGWTLNDVWYISYGAAPAYPLPLIYANGGINASQWYWLSKYAFENKGGRMDFVGEMTQMQACIQAPGSDCVVLDNTPYEGWTYLWSRLQSNPGTAQDLRFSTDIMYYEGGNP